MILDACRKSVIRPVAPRDDMEENSEYVHLVTHHQRRYRISPEARYGRAAGHAVNFHTQKAVLATGATGMTRNDLIVGMVVWSCLVTLGALPQETTETATS